MELEPPVLHECDEVVEDVLCQICFDVVTKCYVCPNQHHFCFTCITRWCRRPAASNTVQIGRIPNRFQTMVLFVDEVCKDLSDVVNSHSSSSSSVYSDVRTLLGQAKHGRKLAKCAASNRHGREGEPQNVSTWIVILEREMIRISDSVKTTERSVSSAEETTDQLSELAVSMVCGLDWVQQIVQSDAVDDISHVVKQISERLRHVSTCMTTDLQTVRENSKKISVKALSAATLLTNIATSLDVEREMMHSDQGGKLLAEMEEILMAATECQNGAHRLQQHSELPETALLQLQHIVDIETALLQAPAVDIHSSQECAGSCPVCRHLGQFTPAPDVDSKVAKFHVGCAHTDMEGVNCSWTGSYGDYKGHVHQFRKRKREEEGGDDREDTEYETKRPENGDGTK